MTATNHALTGAIIGLAVASPLALPLAFVSHYLMDMIPHFGWPLPEKQNLKSNIFRNYLIAEALLCFLVVLVLFTVQPANWFLASICAFLAAMPDMFSYGRYKNVRNNIEHKRNLYERFASKIQWFERPIGAVVEVAWFACAVVILVNLL